MEQSIKNCPKIHKVFNTLGISTTNSMITIDKKKVIGMLGLGI